MLLWAIFLGGMLGAYARYELAGRVYAWAGTAFPWGTLAVNVSGSFALGLMLPVLAALGAAPAWHAVLAAGLLGSFTTFSTFAYETVMLLQDGARRAALSYVAAGVLLGLAGIGAGLAVASLFTA